MVATAKGHNSGQWTRSGTIRTAVSAAVLGVMLGGCSSVPDAVNPVKWYEKTTDFFSGDTQAAQNDGAVAPAGNQGLSADPNAPPPAPAQQTAAAPQGGLSGDLASSNYATPPIDRQGAPADVLRSQSELAQNQPPVPSAAPTQPVIAAPAPMPGGSLSMPSTPPAPPQMAAPRSTPMAQASESDMAAAMPQRPRSLSMDGAPPPPTFNMPANAVSPFGGDEFETVIIGADGMETAPAPRPQLSSPALQASGAASSGAMFPEPGMTTMGQAPVSAPPGMMRVATIHFANNAANLDQRDRSILDAVIQLQRERGGRVVVVGHASSRTKDMDYIRHQMVNFEVSMQRAATVGNTLKSLGLPGEALEIQAVSDGEPLYLEVMPSGEAGNRRVEIYLAS